MPQVADLHAELYAARALVCPACHGTLHRQDAQVCCTACARCYPIRDGIPVLIEAEAVQPGPAGE